MKTRGIIVIIYALLVFMGGVIGYIKAQSIASIAMGTIFGIGLGVSGAGLLKNCKISYYLACGLTLALVIFFDYRFFQSFVFMPAGLMAVLSLVVLGILLTPKASSIENK